MYRQLVCRGRNTAGLDDRLPVDQHYPQRRQRRKPEQTTSSLARGTDIGVNDRDCHVVASS
jgi:hypothetical protein